MRALDAIEFLASVSILAMNSSYSSSGLGSYPRFEGSLLENIQGRQGQILWNISTAGSVFLMYIFITHPYI